MKKIFTLSILLIVIPVCVLAASSDYTWSTSKLVQEVSSNLKSNSNDNTNPLKVECGS